MSILSESLLKDADSLYKDSLLQPESIVKLRLAKLQYTLEALKGQVSSDEPRVLDIQEKLMMTEYHLQDREIKLADKTKQSVADNDADPPHDHVLDELNKLPTGSSGLRKRSPLGLENSPDNPDAMLDIQNYQQQELSENILEMVRTIKENAQLFADKLEKDQDLVSVTTDAITKTVGSVSAVGSKLNKYRRTSAIGWSFYIYSALFIFGSIVFGMVLIQLFPKW